MKWQYHRFQSTCSSVSHGRIDEESAFAEQSVQTWAAATRMNRFEWMQPSLKEEKLSRAVTVEKDFMVPTIICDFIKCFMRTQSAIFYLTTMCFVFISMELGLYMWALVCSFVNVLLCILLGLNRLWGRFLRDKFKLKLLGLTIEQKIKWFLHGRRVSFRGIMQVAISMKAGAVCWDSSDPFVMSNTPFSHLKGWSFIAGSFLLTIPT